MQMPVEQESNLGPGSVKPVRYPLGGGPLLFRCDSMPAIKYFGKND